MERGKRRGQGKKYKYLNKRKNEGLKEKKDEK
jgi:hypothetical protein